MTVLLISILVELGSRDRYDGAEQPACADQKSDVGFIAIFSVAFTFLCYHFNFRIGFSSIN